MQVYTYARKWMRSLITFLHVQLFITLISMPILLYWGMPLSLLSFAGNFLFSPILTIFLLLCSLIFFCGLLGIPAGIFIFLLEKLSHYWVLLMQMPSHGALVALPKPPLIFACAIALLTLGILHCKKINTPAKGIMAYSGLLVFSALALTLSARWAPAIQTLSCNKGQITLIYQKQLVIIDPGVIGQRLSAANWCEYTLMPQLVKEYGTTTIDHFIVLQPNGIIFDTLAHLLEKVTIKKLYLPVWEGTLPKHWWRSYFNLLDQCKKHNCTLIRLCQSSKTLYLEHDKIIICPLQKRISSHDYTYQGYTVTGTVQGHELGITSTKLNRN